MCIYIYIYVHIYIYIYIYAHPSSRRGIQARERRAATVPFPSSARLITGPRAAAGLFGKGDATVGNPHRTQVSQFELFELILSLKLEKRLPVERFEAAVSQSAVPSPTLTFERLIFVCT